MRANHLSSRSAFTLVELLTVITIIGILVGLLVPAVMYAYRSVKVKTISTEVQALASAIEQYKNKYGDYPPDGSNASVFQRHYRKLFPQIAASEFTILDGVANASNGSGGVMDPPEALVFALGGFSSDPVHPFTGTGGPIIGVPGNAGTYQYNVDRSEPLYEFKQAQLSLSQSSSATTSSDESDYYGGTGVDAMPVYRQPYGLNSPFVYFDSRTYSFAVGTGTFFNNYAPSSGAWGFCRPYKSDKFNTNVSATAPNAESYYRYMNDRGFQIIAAGLDDNFGGIAMTGNATGPMFYIYPTGQSLDYSSWSSSTAPTLGTYTRYKDSDPAMNYQLDNSTNFADGPLSDALPN